MSAHDQYARNIEVSQALVARTPAVVTDLLNHSNFSWAAQNCKMAVEASIDLGLLHWRHGDDPRTYFRGAFEAYSKLDAIVRKYKLVKEDFDVTPVYAAMSLMGRDAPVTYFNPDTFAENRWACYQCRVVYALLDQEPSEALIAQADKHLAENDELPDRIFETYFQMLGLLPTRMDKEELLRRAKTTWVERKRHELMAEGRQMDGHGVMNDLYVDIYLAAILKKVGANVHTVHAWLWD